MKGDQAHRRELDHGVRHTVYLETSIISYLAARPSRDLIVAARQQLTHTWWRERRPAFGLYVSQWERAMTDAHNKWEPWRDPIVAEVRRARETIYAATGYDIRVFCRRLREEQATSGHRVVTGVPRENSERPGQAA